MGAGTLTAGRKSFWYYAEIPGEGDPTWETLEHLSGDKSLPDEMLTGSYRPNESTLEQTLPAEIRRRSGLLRILVRRNDTVFDALRTLAQAGTEFYLKHVDAAMTEDNTVENGYGEQLNVVIAGFPTEMPETDPVIVTMNFAVNAESDVEPDS